MHAGHATDADIEGVGPGQINAAILRQAPFGDVHASQELDAGRDGSVLGHGWAQDILQHAVDPETDRERVLGGLDVDVAGPHFLGPAEHVADESHDGGFTGQIPEGLLAGIAIPGELRAGTAARLVLGRQVTLDGGPP